MVNVTIAKAREKYRVLLVRSLDAGFEPSDWRIVPRDYGILSRATTNRLGHADAFKFSHNKAAIASGRFDVWAIVERVKPG